MPRRRPPRPSRSRSRSIEANTLSSEDQHLENLFSSGVRVPLQERPMRTKLKICTEEDYLQVHLTIIEKESRGGIPTLHKVKQRITSVWNKLHVWITQAS